MAEVEVSAISVLLNRSVHELELKEINRAIPKWKRMAVPPEWHSIKNVTLLCPF